MADNVTADAGSGGATFATDDDGTAHHPYTKIEWGADNTQNKVAAASGKALPVQGEAAHDAATTGNPVLVGAEFDDTTPDTVDEGDVGRLRISSRRELYSQIRDAAGNERGLNVDSNGEIGVTLGNATLPDTSGGDLAALGGAVSGNEVQVDVVASLPAGTNAIGKLAANSGVDIGDVDVTSISNAHSADYDSGAGTDTTLAFGIAVPASGGAAVIPGDATAGLKVDLGSDNDVTMSTLPDTSGGDLAALGGAVSGNEVQVDVVASLPAGTNAIGKLAANSGVDIGDVDVTSVPQPSSHYRNIDANAEDAIKGSAGTLYWIHAINLTASVAYLHLYDDTTANVTPGSTTPDFTFPIPTQGDTNGAGFNLSFGPGQSFANAITLVVTTTTDGSTGDPGTNGVMVNAGYA